MLPPPNWQPWHMQAGEPELAFRLFQQFCSMPAPRVLRDMLRTPGFPMSWEALDRTAWEWFWNDRAKHWDAHLADLYTRTIERVTEETAEEVARRQLRLTKSMQELAEIEIDKLLAVSRMNDAPGTVTPRDALRLAANGMRLELLVRGDPTERVETVPDVSAFSAEDLRALRRLQDRAGVR